MSRLVPLLDFVPAATSRFERPIHLRPVAHLLERSRLESLRVVVSAPPRHGKTELLTHAVPWRLLEDPALRIGYATYGQRFSEKRSARMRGIAEHVGVPLAGDSTSKADWRTGVEDGGVWATSIGGPITGEGFELLVIDDPVKDRATAESTTERDKLYDWFNDTAFTRLEPGGACIVFMARWHEDDLAGRLIRDGWDHVVLPAVDAEGQSLWPERWPIERLREIEEKLGPYSWSSLYLGSPMPRGGALFRDAHFYDELPAQFRIGKGIDIAYTAKTRADRSAAVVLLSSGGFFYVASVTTAQVQVPEFLRTLAHLDQPYPGAWHWYTSTTESGLAHLATASCGVHIVSERAAVDKFMRAQGVAAAWNAGKVLLPRRAPWLDAFIAEVCGFVGIGDRRDDQVDALASAFSRTGGWRSGFDPYADADKRPFVNRYTSPLDDGSGPSATLAGFAQPLADYAYSVYQQSNRKPTSY
jgi:predicted phage terminase large subunit-like protein